MTLQVGIDARCLNAAHIRGMGRYVHELLGQSRREADLSWQLYGDDPQQALRSPPGLRAQPDVFSFRGDRFYLWEQIGLPARARRGAVDLLHCTEGSLPWWQPLPTVVTLHDTLAWQERDRGAAAGFYLDRVLPAALAKCAAVVTISESSRRDIVAKWPHLAPKLTVIPHGIGDEYFSDGPGRLTAGLQADIGAAPYIVYLGGPLPRKRFGWAVEVLADSPERDLHLVACGFGSAAREAARQALPAVLRSRVHFAPFLSDEELLALYRGAQAVLYPTLYEGFGFPVVEAQAAGVPVLFSAVSSLGELVGPLSFVVEAQDRAAWGDALVRALALGERRRTLAAEARQWAQAFSWRRSFEAHLAVYRAALASHRR